MLPLVYLLIYIEIINFKVNNQYDIVPFSAHKLSGNNHFVIATRVGLSYTRNATLCGKWSNRNNTDTMNTNKAWNVTVSNQVIGMQTELESPRLASRYK